MAIARGERERGVNFIGHLTSTSGIGVSARGFIQRLLNADCPVVALDVDMGLGNRPAQPLPVEVRCVNTTEELPFAVNVLCLAIDRLPSIFLRRLPGLFNQDFRNVPIIFWEMSVVPLVWRNALAMSDAVITCSPFIRMTIERELPSVPTLHVEQPLDIPFDVPARPRSSLGIPDANIVFMASMDLNGDIGRKNVAAVVEAFSAAFGDRDDVSLVLKVNGDTAKASQHPQIKQVFGAANADKRIILMAATLSYREVIALYRCSDVYVSLHRAEGLGLGLLEAMALGKPVIATGYSGNLAFMTASNSVLIRYRLVPTSNTVWQYSRRFLGDRARWAEPDIAQAIDAMRLLANNAVLRQTLGARAARDVAERQQGASGHAFLADLHAAVGGLRMRHLRPLRNRLALSEIGNPVLAVHNIRAAVQRYTSTRPARE